MSEFDSDLSKGDKLFAEIAKDGRFVGKHFCIDWALMSQQIMPVHASAFKLAGDRAIDGHEKATKPDLGDRLLFPILYLYRHCIELKLKELVYTGLRTDYFEYETVEAAWCNHELLPLWVHVRKMLGDGGFSKVKIQVAEGLINKFHEIDKSGQSLRYDRQKGSFTPLKYKGIPKSFSAAHLKKTMNKLFNFLDGADGGYLDAWVAGRESM